MSNLQCFKRVPIGQTFIHDELDGRNRIRVKYRKSSKAGAFKLKENGVGETHAEVKFTRSRYVEVV